MQQEQVRSIVYALQQNIRRVIVGKDEAIELALIALLCKGHVLIEDVPGVGKTTLVAALAKSLSCTFRRIQFTPDVMPSDITGFCFIDCDTLSGTYNKSLQFFLKGAANGNPNFRQTKVLESLNTWSDVTGWVFCPLNNGDQSDGYWRPISSYNVEPSRTVPLVHINTQWCGRV